jgi:hypothetical protein
MRAKEENDVRPRLDPKMSPKATEGWIEGLSEDIMGRWPWSGGRAGLDRGACSFSRRGICEDVVRLKSAVRAMKAFMMMVMM